MVDKIEIIPVTGLPLIEPGDSIAKLIVEKLREQNIDLRDGDILVVAHSIVSKAEGKIFRLDEIQPSDFAVQLGRLTGKDPRHIEVILRNSKKIVRIGHGVIVCETKHGFVCANAGVDASNSGGADVVISLPDDPDESARKIRREIKNLANVDVAVIITDSFGRPFRKGSVNVAVGCSGINPLADLRGDRDLYGRVLRSKVICVADEIASAAGLVMGEADEGIPAAVVRGYSYDRTSVPASAIVRDEHEDLFR
ncbi:MAG: coenzyme F420-0:L-glutamate ligase [Candidatus Caldarchaeum sp.]|nr:coenzyme F420-0:L-glutamate ligase [Candidatus Caldarchaeum sp.]MCX8201293.1 coenzyme F420-0:L-glutamate ligase [Candidatus Caldarchaeum sp.]